MIIAETKTKLEGLLKEIIQVSSDLVYQTIHFPLVVVMRVRAKIVMYAQNM